MRSVRKIKGFALIEVLISMLILGLALNGIGGFWNKTVQESEHNYARSQAIEIARNIIEAVRANPSQAAWVEYSSLNNWRNGSGANAASCISAADTPLACTPAQMAQADIFLARNYAQTSLPLNSGTVEIQSPCSGLNISCVVVAWADTTPANCAPLRDGAAIGGESALKSSREANSESVIQGESASQCVVIDFIR